MKRLRPFLHLLYSRVSLSRRRGHFLARGAQHFQTLTQLDAALVGGVPDIVVEVLSALA